MTQKQEKTNAMRQLERENVSYGVRYYECEDFIDGTHVADLLGLSYDSTFKTLVCTGKTGKHYVFVIPVAEELDLKAAARSVGEKNVEMLHVKDLKDVTGYIRGGCSPIGMKKPFDTVIDDSCLLFDEIAVSGGNLGVQLTLSPTDLIRVTRAKTEHISI